jgi:hypothetical protein
MSSDTQETGSSPKQTRTTCVFQLIQWKHALKLEAKTGLRHSRGSVRKHVALFFGLPARTPADRVLLAVESLIAECNKQSVHALSPVVVEVTS